MEKQDDITKCLYDGKRGYLPGDNFSFLKNDVLKNTAKAIMIGAGAIAFGAMLGTAIYYSKNHINNLNSPNMDYEMIEKKKEFSPDKAPGRKENIPYKRRPGELYA